MTNSKKLPKELRHYVYIYSNPETNIIFYVGKGQGNRAFDHLSDKSNSKKVKYIENLKKQGLEPKIEILCHDLENKEVALKIESSIIDLLGINNLTNEQKGFRSASFGRMSVEQIQSIYSKQQVNIDEPAILIRINKVFRFDMPPMELYDYTRGHWILNKERADKAKYAFSIYDGIIQEIYEIKRWFKAGETYSVREELERPDKHRNPEKLGENRYEFVGNLATSKIRKKYRLKSVEHLFKKGNANPIMYIKCD